jgi:hypothetical protein
MQTRLLIDGVLTGGEGVAESILDPVPRHVMVKFA